MEVGKIAEKLNSHFRHSSVPLEIFNGAWDIWWATWMIVFSVTSIRSVEYEYLSTIFPTAIWIGVPTLIVGCLQIYAICSGSTVFRLRLALTSLIAWVGILSLVLAANGTGAGPYVVNYGMAAIAEAWVFLRLTRPWK
jgi:hypothetical protein